MIIHLNGMPGVGKFTVAKLLAEKLNARLIDNHLLIDLVLNLCERGSTEYFVLIGKFTDVILAEIAKECDRTFIFTNALSAEFEEDRQRFEQIRQFASKKTIPFVQVLLTCDLAENKRRIMSENRHLKGKLTNTNELDNLYKNHSIYHPPTTLNLKIDTTSLSATEVSGQFNDYIEKISQI